MAGEIRPAILDTVKFFSCLAFTGEIHQLRSPSLHAIGHFIGFDACFDFRISQLLVRKPIEVTQGIQGLPLGHAIDAFGVREMQDGVVALSEGNPLVFGWEETRPPHRGSTAEASPALENHKGREIIGLVSKTIAQPGAHAGAPRNAAAGGHEQLGRGMVKVIGMQRFDDGDVVDDLTQVRQSVGKFGS